MARFWHNGSPTVTCDDACHRARGSEGGEDFALSQGTQLYAPTTGMAQFWLAASGAYCMSIWSDQYGDEVRVMHISAAPGFTLNGAKKHVTEGQAVCKSGGALGTPGAGTSTGAHSHEDAYFAGNSNLVPMSEWVKKRGGGTPPPPPEAEEYSMLVPVAYTANGTRKWARITQSGMAIQITDSNAEANRWKDQMNLDPDDAFYDDTSGSWRNSWKDQISRTTSYLKETITGTPMTDEQIQVLADNIAAQLDLTPEMIDAIAEATADELHERSAE